MRRFTKVADATTEAVHRVVEGIETKVLVAEGRRSVKAKAKSTINGAKKAMKAGAMAGAMTAVAVVAREVRKRRKLNA